MSDDDKQDFTHQDAAALIRIARRAPLANMDEAQALQNLLDRFTDFFEAIQNNVTEIKSGSAE